MTAPRTPPGGLHSHSEALGDSEPRRWQGTAGPLRKQSQVRGVPDGEGEWEGMGLLLGATGCLATSYHFASCGPTGEEGTFQPDAS